MNLPSIIDAPLPAVYERAAKALAECSRIDECQDWANKAQAMASYARQANDETLMNMATRIKGRAIRRCGELLQRIEPARGARADLGPVASRGSVANGAGLSERQRKTALRVASIPAAKFESQIESASPPTVTTLAKQGTTAKPKPIVDLAGIDPQDYARATEAMGNLRRFADYCGAHDAAMIASAIQSHEVALVRVQVASVDAWLDAFVVNLKG